MVKHCIAFYTGSDLTKYNLNNFYIKLVEILHLLILTILFNIQIEKKIINKNAKFNNQNNNID